MKEGGVEDLKRAGDDYLTSTDGLEREMQELTAILECTQCYFLTPDWLLPLGGPAGRVQLQGRFAELRVVTSCRIDATAPRIHCLRPRAAVRK